MTAYIITYEGKGFACRTRRRNEHEALCDLLEKVKGCFEIRFAGARKEPLEITAEWLMGNCREVELF